MNAPMIRPQEAAGRVHGGAAPLREVAHDAALVPPVSLQAPHQALACAAVHGHAVLVLHQHLFIGGHWQAETGRRVLCFIGDELQTRAVLGCEHKRGCEMQGVRVPAKVIIHARRLVIALWLNEQRVGAL
jgi:hypothetical protein